DRETGAKIEGVATAMCDGIEIRIPLKGLINIEEELARLNKEIARVDADIAFVSRKLSNEKFVAKAPAEIINKEREKLANYEAERTTLLASLAELKALEASG